MTNKKTIAIIGAGITGLTAAYYLQREINKQNLPYHIMLIEASGRLGGKIQTVKQDGFIIERGPDSFLARKQPAVRLAENLGLQDELVRNSTGQAYILVDETLHKMPKGSFMGIPTDLEAFFETELLTEKGKARAGMDLTLPRNHEVGDQSLGHFFRHRFGDELVENIIEPLLSGIYAGDLDQMSLLATFPNFLALEQQYGSLIKGLQQTREKSNGQTGKTPGQFFSFKNGLGTLVNQLEKEIKDEVEIIHDEVTQIVRKEQRYHVSFRHREDIQADAVLMTTSHQVLPKIFSDYDLFTTLLDVPSTSVANVALAFDQSAIEQELDGTGFVVSRNSPYHITACTWTHKKWENTTPDGKAFIRAYVGKPTDQNIVQLSDEEIVEIVLQDLNKTMRITKKPEFAIVTRWKNAMPQYTVGHKERIEQIRKQMDERLPGLFLAGASFEGVGIPDCIGQAENMVAASLAFLQEVE